MHHWNRRCRAFTLIECLVSTVILGVGVIGVAGMFACASLSERKASHIAQARQIAEETLEAVRAGGYDLSSSPSGSCSVPTPGLPRSSGALAWQPYAATSGEVLNLVVINIQWSWPQSTGGSYNVATLVAAEGGSGS